MSTYPNRLFRKTTFRPLGVQRPQIFTRAIEWPSIASAPHTEDLRPPYNFLKKVPKLALIVAN